MVEGFGSACRSAGAEVEPAPEVEVVAGGIVVVALVELVGVTVVTVAVEELDDAA
jgi:hypothetical protein